MYPSESNMKKYESIRLSQTLAMDFHGLSLVEKYQHLIKWHENFIQ